VSKKEKFNNFIIILEDGRKVKPLKKGYYRVKFLRDVYGSYNVLHGLKDEVKTVYNDGLKPSYASMGTRHYAWMINIDGGMGPSDNLEPGVDIEILEEVVDYE